MLAATTIRAASDPTRQWISDFGSGLEHLWEALQYQHDSKARNAVLALSIRCLVLNIITNTLAFILPDCYTMAYRQLLYPAIFLFRYLQPQPWDQLFMSTVRSLGCSRRSDLVARPGPEYFSSLRLYVRRLGKTYAAISAIQWLVNRNGLLKYPCTILALIAVDQILKYKGIKNTLWKLVVLTAFIGPRWPVWVVQTALLQQLFMYELLQPYLSRAQFKHWEERAWLAQNEAELQGFAFGGWVLCSIPFFGAAVIPFMFRAVAFPLARSCGSFENTGSSLGGDVIERRSPGVKAVALGESKSVEGNWDAVKIRTFVRNLDPPTFKPKAHIKNNSRMYNLDGGLDKAVDVERIRIDKGISLSRKTELYKEAELEARRTMMQNWSMRGWDPRLAFGNSSMQSDPSFDRVSSSSAATSHNNHNNNASNTSQDDFLQYNFSDRKTLDSAPSAPPAPSGSPSAEVENAFRAQSTATVADDARYSPQEDRLSQMNAVRESKMRAADAKRQAAEAKRQAQEVKRNLAEQIRATKGRLRQTKKAHESNWRAIVGSRLGTDGKEHSSQESTEVQNEQEEDEEASLEAQDEADEQESKRSAAEEGDDPSIGEGGYGWDAFGGWNRGGAWRGGPGRWGPRGPRGSWGPRGSTRGGHGGHGRNHRGIGQRRGSSRLQTEEDDEEEDETRATNASSGEAGLAWMIQTIEENVGQQLGEWGGEIMRRVKDALVDPENPKKLKIKIGGTTS
ncbi:hypothetical protein BGZ99_009340 [Dissophora globulifera]|uniref:Uncharacterized protein n=1 Tax=Dissophora globulifera TaxID=979702 RepID=A0A9P6RSG6_9FUNG|nr:hypothetical protein BGZ99_009340 [Dissophora globulifera]